MTTLKSAWKKVQSVVREVFFWSVSLIGGIIILLCFLWIGICLVVHLLYNPNVDVTSPESQGWAHSIDNSVVI